MVILTVKAGVTREQVMAVMPAEIRQTVQLYLNGKIREWYSRGDGRGAVFLLDTSDVAEAEAIMEALPLAKEKIIDHEQRRALAADVEHAAAKCVVQSKPAVQLDHGVVPGAACSGPCYVTGDRVRRKHGR